MTYAMALADDTPPTEIEKISGGIARIIYENVGGQVLGAGVATSGQAFARGELAAGYSLQGTIGGAAVAVQLDVKTTYDDGSVKFGVLSVERPALAAGEMVTVVLAGVPTPAPVPHVDFLAGLAAHSFNAALTGTDNVTHNVNVMQALRDAIANGTATWWLDGPLVRQARVEVLVDFSLRTVFDVSVFKDGEIGVRQQINNDAALGESGGRATYDVTLKLDGQVASEQRVDHGQYQNWHNDFSSSANNGGFGHGDATKGWLNIRTDIAHLQAANIIADFDLKIGVDEALLAVWGERANSFGWNDALSSHEVTQYMPGSGGRADIGFTTEANAAWLMTGDVRAASFAMGQAEAAGAVPWHFWDPRAGMYLNVQNYPGVWTDGRGGIGTPGDPNAGGLSQPSDGLAGWTLDSAHQPDLSFVPYLLTGDRWILDNLNAQAAWNIVGQYPPLRGETHDLVVLENQVRGSAWSLRQIDESAWASPDGSADKAYFTASSAHNWAWLVAQIPRWTAEQGEAHGWLPGVYGTPGAMPPWQQDYFASTAIAAANRGNADARTFLEWQSNFLIGRFTHEASGFTQHDGVTYLIANTDLATGLPYKTWAEIGAATVARGYSNGEGWTQSQGDYAQLGLATLAGLAETLGSRAAAAAYHALLAENPPFTSASDFARDPTFAVAPPSELVALSIVLGAESWQGNPLAVVLLDGVEVFRGEITAPHAEGGAPLMLGMVNDATHVVTVQFLNDAWGGTKQTDRNLHVEDILLGGVSTGQSAELTITGSASFAVSAPADAVIPSFGSGANTIRIGVSGDAWNGLAHFTLLLDGVVVVPDMPATAAHATSATAYFDVKSDLGAAGHQLTVRFANDAFGGSAGTDRNLYVDSVAVDGVNQNKSAALMQDGDATFLVAAAPTHDLLRIGLSGDMWQGAPRFLIIVDGEQMGGERTTSASHVGHAVEYFDIATRSATGKHDVVVRFLNDLWGGNAAQDRNLYVDSIALNGEDRHMAAALTREGDAAFAVIAVRALDVLRIGLSADVWQAAPRFLILIDGKQIGGERTTSAEHLTGSTEFVDITANFAAGQHQLIVRFLNDLWGGSKAQDRNLYVDSIAFNGFDLNQGAPLYATGDAVFTF